MFESLKKTVFSTKGLTKKESESGNGMESIVTHLVHSTSL